MSDITELMMAPWFARDYDACAKIIDDVSPGGDRESRESIASWRSRLSERAGDFEGALKL